jgi:hypothetical protein
VRLRRVAANTPISTTTIPANTRRFSASPSTTAPSSTAITGSKYVTVDAVVGPSSAINLLSSTNPYPVPSAPSTTTASTTGQLSRSGCHPNTGVASSIHPVATVICAADSATAGIPRLITYRAL